MQPILAGVRTTSSHCSAGRSLPGCAPETPVCLFYLRALIEDGLRHVLDAEPARKKYRLPDPSVGKPGGPNPLEALSWQDLRDEIYGGR